MCNGNLNSKIRRSVNIIRNFRLVHRISGIVLVVFVLFIGITGIMLGWKKHSGGYLLPKTQHGTSTEFSQWKPLHVLHSKALQVLADSVSTDLNAELSRVDIRQQKGVVKFVFDTHLWEIQLDGATGNLLSLSKRRSDLIENFHDGSFLDHYFETNNEPIKLFYTTIMGISLILFSISGFWIWIGPKLLKKIVKKQYGKNNRKTH